MACYPWVFSYGLLVLTDTSFNATEKVCEKGSRGMLAQEVRLLKQVFAIVLVAPCIAYGYVIHAGPDSLVGPTRQALQDASASI